MGFKRITRIIFAAAILFVGMASHSPEAKAYCSETCGVSNPCPPDTTYTGPIIDPLLVNGACCGTATNAERTACWCNYYPNASNHAVVCGGPPPPTPTPSICDTTVSCDAGVTETRTCWTNGMIVLTPGPACAPDDGPNYCSCFGGGGGQVTFNPPSEYFGPVQLGTGLNLTVTVTNTTGQQLANCALTRVNTSDFSFVANSCSGATLDLNDTCSFALRAGPGTLGLRTTRVNLTCDAMGIAKNKKKKLNLDFLDELFSKKNVPTVSGVLQKLIPSAEACFLGQVTGCCPVGQHWSDTGLRCGCHDPSAACEGGPGAPNPFISSTNSGIYSVTGVPSSACTCPNGGALSGTTCTQPATPLSCALPFVEGTGSQAGTCIVNCCGALTPNCSDCTCNGGTPSGQICSNGPIPTPGPAAYQCPSGWAVAGSTCTQAADCPATACPYSVGSGIDCTAVTCGSGTKYYFQFSGSLAEYLTNGDPSATVGNCYQNSATAGIRQQFEYACGSVDPATLPALSTCSDNPSLSYFNKPVSYPTCGLNTSPCTGTPTPTATPPGSSCFDTGGAGRECSTSATCCPGYTCQIAGAQPMTIDHNCVPGTPGCTVPVILRAGFSAPSPSEDPLLNGVSPYSAVASAISKFTGPSRICVNTAAAPTVTPAAPPQFIHHPARVNGKINPIAIRWDALNNALRCELNTDDKFRARPATTAPAPLSIDDGCSCNFGYEPVVLTLAQYSTYMAGGPSKKLNWLWAQVMEALERHPEQVKAVSKVVANVWENVVPNAEACTYYTEPPACNTFPSCVCSQSGFLTLTGYTWAGCMCCSQNPPTWCSGGPSPTPPPPFISPCCLVPPGPPGDPNNCSFVDPPGIPDPDPGMCGLASPTPTATPVGTATPTPTATPASTPILMDKGSINGAALAWQPWAGASYNYSAGGYATNPAVTAVIPTAKLACVRECPAGSTRACYDGSTGTCDPKGDSACTCTTGVFSAASWSCVTCAPPAAPAGSYPDVLSGLCRCPDGYDSPNVGGVPTCRPRLLPDAGSTEYRLGTAAMGPAEGYPVCGPGRLPVREGFQIANVASNYLPKSSMVTAGTAYPVPYPYSSPGNVGAAPTPIYLFNEYNRCACSGHSDPGGPVLPASNAVVDLSSTSGGVPRFYADTFDAIAARGSDNKPVVPYGPVAIAHDDGLTNGRLGSKFDAATTQCGCPNVNETLVRNNPIDALSGSRCEPALIAASTDPASVRLVKFLRTIHDNGANSIVMNAANEPTTGSGDIVEKILLAPDGTDRSTGTMQVYERNIWTCQLGLTLGLPTGTCTFLNSDNMCDGSSEASPFITGSSYSQRFANAVNKKLNCCGFQFGSAMTLGSSPVKFDCIANENKGYPNFDALWSSTDETIDGGQINAVILADKGGRVLTGWYTLDGKKCTQYGSVSTQPIVRGRVNPLTIPGQQQVVAGGQKFEAMGGTIPVPAGPAWTALLTGLGNPTAPQPNLQTADQVRAAIECPVFVRAAAVYGCNNNAIGSNTKRTFKQTDIRDGKDKYRCAAADRTMIHIRVEQVWEILGRKSMATMDTVIDNTAIKQISLEDLWQVNGFGSCPAGGVRDGDACVY